MPGQETLVRGVSKGGKDGERWLAAEGEVVRREGRVREGWACEGRVGVRRAGARKADVGRVGVRKAGSGREMKEGGR